MAQVVVTEVIVERLSELLENVPEIQHNFGFVELKTSSNGKVQPVKYIGNKYEHIKFNKHEGSCYFRHRGNVAISSQSYSCRKLLTINVPLMLVVYVVRELVDCDNAYLMDALAQKIMRYLSLQDNTARLQLNAKSVLYTVGGYGPGFVTEYSMIRANTRLTSDVADVNYANLLFGMEINAVVQIFEHCLDDGCDPVEPYYPIPPTTIQIFENQFENQFE
jgi:hypothetical protein